MGAENNGSDNEMHVTRRMMDKKHIILQLGKKG